MKRYLFKLFCHDGGGGWGKTGQKGKIIVEEKSVIQATQTVRLTIPGGWQYEYVGETKEQAGLWTDLSRREFQLIKEEKLKRN